MRYHPQMAYLPLASACTSRSGLRFARLALLWLALLLGLAQTVAIRHTYSHSPHETSSSAGKHPGGLAHCNACILAASLGSGPPPAAALLLPALARVLPKLTTPVVWRLEPPYQPYAIRAPPVTSA